ncbi:MAG TPA: hypothetical protein EYP90_14935, partial [Chromatiaceae bacterium]|nr:hypothetical protein [Chromatiaceae bacterium]
MNPEQIFCPNIDCPARGQVGKGNIHIHSQKEKRCSCDVCETTFSVTKGTLFYRLKTDPATVMPVLVLLAYGCPVPAIVAAFGFDERTVKNWWQKAGDHSQKVHQNQIGESHLDLEHVQADEIKVKTQQGAIWMALAIMVSPRLWLGGVISAKRDKGLIRALVGQIRRIALYRPLLIAVDGLPSYVKAFQEAFRTKLPRYGQSGRSKLRAWSELYIVQVIKKRSSGRFSVTRRIVQGSVKQITALLRLTQGGGKINTAYIERLNATFR